MQELKFIHFQRWWCLTHRHDRRSKECRRSHRRYEWRLKVLRRQKYHCWALTNDFSEKMGKMRTHRQTLHHPLTDVCHYLHWWIAALQDPVLKTHREKHVNDHLHNFVINLLDMLSGGGIEMFFSMNSGFCDSAGVWKLHIFENKINRVIIWLHNVNACTYNSIHGA